MAKRKVTAKRTKKKEYVYLLMKVLLIFIPVSIILLYLLTDKAGNILNLVKWW